MGTFTTTLHLLSLFGVNLLLVNCDILHHHILESPKITNWGVWGSLENCPIGTFVTGMQLKVEAAEGWKDDTGLNGIRLFCSRLGSAGKDESPTVISSSVGPFGEWRTIFRCEGENLNPETSAVVGFQLRIETPKGVKDDTSTNNFRVFCKDLAEEGGESYKGQRQRLGQGGSESHLGGENEETSSPTHLVLEGDGTGWGEWTDSQLCRNGYAICGIATQVDHGHGDTGYDDTGLNNVRAECCKVRFHDRDFHEEREERPKPFDDIMFPDPIESARNLQKTLLEMQTQKTILETTPTPPSPSSQQSQEPPVEGRNYILYYYPSPITVPEVLKVDDPSNESGGTPPRSQQDDISDKYSAELDRLATLAYGHPKVNTSVPEEAPHQSHTLDEIPNNIPPPELGQPVNSDLKDRDADVNQGQIHVILSTTTAPTTTTQSPPVPAGNRSHLDLPSGRNQLLIVSGSSNHIYHSFGISMFLLAFCANYVLL